MSAPSKVRFTPDGQALTYLHSPDGSLVRSLWLHDLSTGERRVIAGPTPESSSEDALTDAERLRRQRTRTTELGVTDYAFAASATVPTLVVPVAGQVLTSRGHPLPPALPLPGVDDAAGAAVSPDGERVAYVVHGDVWIAPLHGDVPRRLTADAEPGVSNGLADYIAAEELGRFDGLWWSADSLHLAVARVDERDVPEHVIAHLASVTGGHESHRYPFAGGPNATVQLRIVPSDGGEAALVPLPMTRDDYLARVVAHPLGGWLVAVLPRDQRSLRWVAVDISGGCRELWVEHAEPWVNLDDDTRVLADGRVLRTTERSGFRHLELRDADGTQGPVLTIGEWVVTSVVHVDEARGEVWFLGTCDGPTERHVYRVPFAADAPLVRPRRLTREAGWHEVVVSGDGSRWADTWSSLDTAPQVVVRERDGHQLTRIHAATETAAGLRLLPPALIQLTAADGKTPLHGLLYRPSPSAASTDGQSAVPHADGDADPGHSSAASAPPCVVWVYGGPHSQYACNAWDATVHPLRQLLARHGLAVLVVDNRGTSHRGVAFERVLDRRLGTVEIEDQVAAVEQLVAGGEIDPTRVGITGGSYGGYVTLLAMARHPDIFRVGVAVAPVGDWRGYDTAYTERYLGTPGENAEAYRACSAVAAAGQIGGDLLLIHGVLDENVHLAHSVQVLATLQAAGRDVELLLIPDQRHRLRGEAAGRHVQRRTAMHLLAGLGVEPSDELLALGTDAEVGSSHEAGTAATATV